MYYWENVLNIINNQNNYDNNVEFKESQFENISPKNNKMKFIKGV